MPFIVKATYRNETRKITFVAPHVPPFQELKDQLSRVFNLKRSFHLSNVCFSEDKSCKLLIGQCIRTLEEYNLYCSPFQGASHNNGCLTFTVVEETSSGVGGLSAQPRSGAISSVPGWQFPNSNAPKAKSTSCCSVTEGKKEIKDMIDGFLSNLQQVIGDTFGDNSSFSEPLDTSRRNEPLSPPSPLPPLDLDTSLHIPGTFMRSRPETPSMVVDELSVEMNQSLPRLEPYQSLHPGIWCDFCGRQIKGLRFKCQECPHYDLCANCIVVNRALDKHNEDQSMIHRFSTITAPTSEEPSVPNLPAVPQATNASPIQANPHYTVYCDRCDIRITGRRYKCLNCLDYDLCETCIGFANEHNSTHRFLAVHSSSIVNFHTTPAIISPPISETTSQAAHHARCDLCDSRIVGQRFKCVDCPDFDTCSSCFVITPQQHPNHSFVKIHDQDDYLVRREPELTYHFATCDACDKRIVGVRYKCLHPDCPDFDLCQNCEALPFSQHPDTHPMLKLKYGNTYIPPRPKEQAVQVSQPVQTSISEVSIKLEEAPDQLIGGTTPALKADPERTCAGTSKSSAPSDQVFSLKTAESTTDSSATPVTHDPKEAEERSRYLVDKEIRELENARRRKHESAARQISNKPDARSFLEEVKATFSDEPSVYKLVLERLLECFNTTDTSTICIDLKDQFARALREYPDLQASLDNLVVNELLMSPSARNPAVGPTSIVQGMSDIIQASTKPATRSYSATFISENIPDGNVFPSGTEFIKSWHIRNDGPAWVNVEIVFVGGNRLNASPNPPSFYPVDGLATGEEADIVVKDMKAPEEPGRYISHWRLRDANLNYFGPAMWCDIISAEVDSDGSQDNSLSSSAVVMPEIAPIAAATTATSTPATVPASALMTDDSSEVSSVPSVSILDHSDGEWDDLRDVPALASLRSGNRDDYQVVYDSDDDL